MTDLHITSATGVPVEITVAENIDSVYLSRVSIPGKVITTSASALLSAVGQLPKTMASKIVAAAPTATHVLVVANGLAIALTPDAAAVLQSAIDAKQAEIDERPHVKMRKLIAERAAMYSERSSLLAEQGEVISDAHDSEYANALSRVYARSREINAQVDAISARIAEWEAAHREVMAKIEREKEESIARNRNRLLQRRQQGCRAPCGSAGGYTHRRNESWRSGSVPARRKRGMVSGRGHHRSSNLHTRRPLQGRPIKSSRVVTVTV